MRSSYFVTLAVGPVFTLVFAALIWFHRRRHYATWAKVLSIVACVAGVGWYALGTMVAEWKTYHLSRDAYFTLVGFKGIFGGIVIGIITSILAARPYSKPDARSPQA
jgi:hypothetical protein